MNNTSEDNFSTEIDWREKFINYGKRWYWFVLSICFALLLGKIYVFFSTPKFQIESFVIAQDDKKSSKAPGQELLKELNMFSGSQLVENEIEILRSRALIKKIVKQLKLDEKYYKIGLFKNTELYGFIPVTLIHDTIIKPISEKSYLIQLVDSSHCIFSYESDTASFNLDGSKVFKFGDEILTPIGKFSVLKTQNFDRIFVGKSKNQISDEFRKIKVRLYGINSLTNSYKDQLKIELTTKMSTVLKLSIQDNVPQRGRNFLNALMQEYIISDINLKNQTGQISLDFINERIKFLSNDVDNIETVYENFRSQNNITDLSLDAKNLLESLSLYDKEITKLESQLKLLEELEKYTNNKAKYETLVPALSGIDDPMILELTKRIIEVENQRTLMKSSLKEDNLLWKSLLNQVEALKSSLFQAILNSKNNIKTTLGLAKQNSGMFLSEVKKLPRKEHQLFDIKRQMEIKQNLYIYLLQKEEEAALSLASTVSDNRVLDEAISSEEPIKPVKKLIYLFSLIFGFVLPVGLIELRSAFNTKIKSKTEITKMVSFPFVGAIPFVKSLQAIVVGDNAKSGISEAFRNIRTNLMYLTKGSQRMVISVTSNISGEGKTFFTLNLAASLAIAGKRVVMIELDLRKPKLSQTIGISNSSNGISNYLIGMATYEEILKPSGQHPNLFIISSGPIPPNPSELLLQESLKLLIKRLSEEFDFVIFDTAPIALVSDAFAVTDQSHLVFYIVRHNYTDKSFLSFMEDMNKSGKLKDVAVVLNGIENNKNSYGYNAYGSYGYGYGYGYYSDDNPKETFWKRIFKKKV